jgi:N-acetylglucosamine-6-phosphate deacetylase
MARRLAGAGRTAFITDAMAAAGVGDGVYRLGEREVRVEGGRAMLADGSSLAGSCLTMDRAFARAVRGLGLSLVDAAQAGASVPARLLSLDDRGSLAPAKRADLVVLGEDLEVLAVMIQGRWIAGTVPGRTGSSRAEDEDPLGAGAKGSGSTGGRRDHG